MRVLQNLAAGPKDASSERHNTALQTDERRLAVAAFRRLTPAPLAAERKNRWAHTDSSMTNWEAYGPPAIQLEALRVWVHGYQFPESMDAWDGNWLRVTAHCAESGASVVVTGAFLDTVSFLRFHRELKRVYDRVEGMATLESDEPELKVEVRAVGPTGHIEVQVDITPDQLSQAHRFSFTIDQSYLPEVLRSCERLLGQYPVRDPKARGA